MITVFFALINPILVGIVLQLFSHWLDEKDKQ
ncbi:type I toxin-antitoxin system Fst family toxin [Vagococcus coleopterorum]|uniref:Type I toxin-antitoxin system Fst family toxin n=1 Tax=Vagococcus coleopterorum TaxID=2714946 RepID=A0A6G8APG3_9ENTE|nr:type I toxin-antitoxin system Fst family toxin [Vagococcus coleopterorum]QIL46877.1 type I toxin-antitoxin system Fst family toxin [Vagococcus coleopterorum]